MCSYFAHFANIIPLKNNKAPDVKKWSLYQSKKTGDLPDCSKSPAYGIICGKYARLFVVDFDEQDGLRTFLNRHPQLKWYFDNTLTVLTRRGHHIFFHSSNPPKSFKSGKIDIISDGKYVVGLGSVISNFKDDSNAEPHEYVLAPDSSGEILDLDDFEDKNIKDQIVSALLVNDVECEVIEAEDEYLSDIVEEGDMFAEKLWLNGELYQNLLWRIGARKKVLREYLEFKNHSYLGCRSDYDFSIVKMLVLAGLGDAEIYAFYYRVNNPNVKACERLLAGKKNYLKSMIDKNRVYAGNLENKRRENRNNLRALRDAVLKADAGLLFPNESKCVQARLHGSLIILIDYCAKIGFSDSVFLGGEMFGKMLGCGKSTGYKRIGIFLKKYKYIVCVSKGSNYSEKMSRFNLAIDRLFQVIYDA